MKAVLKMIKKWAKGLEIEAGTRVAIGQYIMDSNITEKLYDRLNLKEGFECNEYSAEQGKQSEYYSGLWIPETMEPDGFLQITQDDGRVLFIGVCQGPHQLEEHSEYCSFFAYMASWSPHISDSE